MTSEINNMHTTVSSFEKINYLSRYIHLYIYIEFSVSHYVYLKIEQEVKLKIEQQT